MDYSVHPNPYSKKELFNGGNPLLLRKTIFQVITYSATRKLSHLATKPTIPGTITGAKHLSRIFVTHSDNCCSFFGTFLTRD
eukprot:scaffold5532_cov180-Amphora_coffeaeformis.AAC.3